MVDGEPAVAIHAMPAAHRGPAPMMPLQMFDLALFGVVGGQFRDLPRRLCLQAPNIGHNFWRRLGYVHKSSFFPARIGWPYVSRDRPRGIARNAFKILSVPPTGQREPSLATTVFSGILNLGQAARRVRLPYPLLPSTGLPSRVLDRRPDGTFRPTGADSGDRKNRVQGASINPNRGWGVQKRNLPKRQEQAIVFQHRPNVNDVFLFLRSRESLDFI